jgi:hypothetical protein
LDLIEHAALYQDFADQGGMGCMGIPIASAGALSTIK